MEQTYSRTASYANRVSVVIIKGYKEGRRFVAQNGVGLSLRVVLGILASVYPTNVVIISRNVARQGLRLNISQSNLYCIISRNYKSALRINLKHGASFNKNINPTNLPVFVKLKFLFLNKRNIFILSICCFTTM